MVRVQVMVVNSTPWDVEQIYSMDWDDKKAKACEGSVSSPCSLCRVMYIARVRKVPRSRSQGAPLCSREYRTMPAHVRPASPQRLARLRGISLPTFKFADPRLVILVLRTACLGSGCFAVRMP